MSPKKLSTLVQGARNWSGPDPAQGNPVGVQETRVSDEVVVALPQTEKPTIFVDSNSNPAKDKFLNEEWQKVIKAEQALEAADSPETQKSEKQALDEALKRWYQVSRESVELSQLWKELAAAEHAWRAELKDRELREAHLRAVSAYEEAVEFSLHSLLGRERVGLSTSDRFLI